MVYPLTLKLKSSIYSGSTINIQVSQKFLRSEKLQTEVSFSFITLNNILFLIITLFQAPEKVPLLKIQTESSEVSNSTSCLDSTPFSRGPSRLVSRSCSWMSTTSSRSLSELWSRSGSWCSTLPSRYLMKSCSTLSQWDQLRPQSVLDHVQDVQADESSGTILNSTISRLTLIFILILSGCFTRIGLKFSSDESTLGLRCLETALKFFLELTNSRY